MYHCKYLQKELEPLWEDFASQHPAAGFHQSFHWARFKQSDGWNTYKVGLFDNSEKLVGGAILLQFEFQDGTNFFYIPEGPLLDYTNEDRLFWQWRALSTAIFSMIDLEKDAQTTHLRVEPRITEVPEWFFRDFQKAPLNLMPRHTQQIDLSQTEDEILADMKQKGRYNIKLARKRDVVIEKCSLDVELFFSLYKETFQRNQFEGKNLDFFKKYQKSCSDFSELFVAQHPDHGVIAAALVVYYGKRATYLYGASSSEHRKFMAPYLLHWEIMQDAKARGFTAYDFWGIHHSAEDSSHDWHGITQFKKKFGGQQLDFVGAYDWIFQRDLYDRFVKKYEA